MSRQRYDSASDRNHDIKYGLSVQTAWDAFRGHFHNIVKFCVGLSTLFMSTASVDSDFSVLQWEKYLSCTSRSDLSLEGILQTKQFAVISTLSK